MKDRPVINLAKVTSTNDYAIHKLAEQNLQDGTVILAREQTAGRGVEGNTWVSEEGKNLTFSMIIYPEYIRPDQQFYLTKAFSLGILKVFRSHLGTGCAIKWPNDIYFGMKKIAGILIQNGIRGNTFSYCVAGIGLNVNQVIFSKDIPNPVSMKLVTGKDYDLMDLLYDFCQGISGYLDMLKNVQIEALDHEYLSALFRMNEVADYVYHGKKIKGMIKGVDRYGHLILEVQPGEIIECDLKEIKFVV